MLRSPPKDKISFDSDMIVTFMIYSGAGLLLYEDTVWRNVLLIFLYPFQKLFVSHGCIWIEINWITTFYNNKTSLSWSESVSDSFFSI